MKNKFKITLIFIIFLTITCVFFVKKSHYINSSTNFVTLLKSDGNSTSLQILDLNKNNIIYNNKIAKTSDIYYGQTSISKGVNITAIANKIGEYDIYNIDNKNINKLGSLPPGVFGVEYFNCNIYVLSYNLASKDHTPSIKVYKNNDITHPLKTYELKGDIQDFEISKETGNCYAVSIDQGKTYLYSLINNTLKKEKIFNEQIASNISIKKDRLFISCGDKLIGDIKTSKDIKKISINKIYFKDIDKSPVPIISTSMAPYNMQIINNNLYVVTGINQSNIEVYDLKTNKLVFKQVLPTGPVYGMHSYNNKVYIFTQDNILVFNGTKSSQIYSITNNPIISMKVN
ncbi:hypothetical protein [Clostridium estertheticum]|uniref:hypothetical protein n=1 Tax=Clostridium estertheticum TaxID=238834 RepID=UPI001C7D1EB2|nr:hypothetical protein [Clostridium estertheticum]MBX4267520.1 hypothetical protein [Clostridium estertheticum]WLC91335.1 hypothetical protein KTC95_24175 [Clostridium estertheticum]